MSLTEIVIAGTIKADGSLQLDEKPNLSPGRVTIVLRRESEPAAPPRDDWLQHLQRIRAQRESSGYPFMTEAEVSDYIAWLREGDRFDEILPYGSDAIG